MSKLNEGTFFFGRKILFYYLAGYPAKILAGYPAKSVSGATLDTASMLAAEPGPQRLPWKKTILLTNK